MKRTLLAATVAAVAIVGCGGSGGGVVRDYDRVQNGTLTVGDLQTGGGYYYDEYVVIPSQSGRATFGMASDQVDSYLILEDENGNIIAQDDNGGFQTDAQVGANLVRDRTYYLIATSASPGDLGDYQIGWFSWVDLVENRSASKKRDFTTK